eukprot:3850766-Rhodomonas_salina.5
MACAATRVDASGSMALNRMNAAKASSLSHATGSLVLTWLSRRACLRACYGKSGTDIGLFRCGDVAAV